MGLAIISGAGGLIGSQSARFFVDKGFEVHGIDNDMRAYFFGADATTSHVQHSLEQEFDKYTHHALDIRDVEQIERLFSKYGEDIEVVIHAAAQPSHDWAAKEPFTDFSVNAVGTMNLLEMTRKYAPKASFIFTSTNKVYGDTPNRLPLIEMEKRWEVSEDHDFAKLGINETMSIDQSKHSLFGASKLAADVMVQEYGKYFGMNTVCFRGGCLTGPLHVGAELHGFLSYLGRCAVENKPYTIFGYKGKQVRDNIHSADLVEAFWQYHQAPRAGEVYNIGGGRFSNCSVLEAFDICAEITNSDPKFSISDDNRIGDHIWWISDTSKFETDYPNWKRKYNIRMILNEILESWQSKLSQGNSVAKERYA
ncbi:MAG: NAD-dependent epimerase/dehydratase family protein [Alphaproteobacteria bacterium]|nr:NAD-dependent epimerase/dehydratase family protein [Alphaproteobacteria bacterium]